MTQTVTTPKQHGEFKRLTQCRLCRGRDLSTFIEFGDVPLAGAFLKPDQIPDERVYPMGMQFCRTCTSVQVDTVISVETLFKRYFYFSSAIQTLRDHFGLLADEIAENFAKPGKGFVVEIGANDGVLQRHLVAKGIDCVGVDPATNVVESIKDEGVRVINDCFTEKIAKGILSDQRPADIIVSSFSFAHIDDMHDVVRGIDALLADDGAFIFEVYYLGIVIEEMQYDMMYHEHMTYYTMHALEKFLGPYGLEIFNVQRIELRSGTLRFYAQRKGKGKRPVTGSVERHRIYEKDHGLLDAKTYEGFGDRVEKTKTALLMHLDALKEKGKKIIGYGASGRATVIMNYCGIGTNYLDYVVDDAPAKHGFLTPGTHIPIKPWEATEEGRKPDVAVVFAWPFIREVKKKRQAFLDQGGTFIVPLPEVKVLDS